MAVIDLMFDEKRNLFSILVILTKKPSHGMSNIPGKSTRTEWCNAVIYLYTGSNLTSITENALEKLNLNRVAFNSEKVGGIGGFLETPTTNEINISVMSRDSMISIN